MANADETYTDAEIKQMMREEAAGENMDYSYEMANHSHKFPGNPSPAVQKTGPDIKVTLDLGWIDGGSVLFLVNGTEHVVPADHLRAWLDMREYLSAEEATKKEMLRTMGCVHTPANEKAPRPTRGIMLCMDGRESTPINIKLCGTWYTGLAEDLRTVMEESRVE